MTDDFVKIETYKDIDIYYNKHNGKLRFDFENRERIVNYLFEAKDIIDSPAWEEYYLEGYYIDGYHDKDICLAIAKRKNTKNGRPDWLGKGRYKLEYSKYDGRVYPRTKERDEVYKRWEKQKDIYNQELRKLNSIVEEIKK